jgi:hypothetical protein
VPVHGLQDVLHNHAEAATAQRIPTKHSAVIQQPEGLLNLACSRSEQAFVGQSVGCGYLFAGEQRDRSVGARAPNERFSSRCATAEDAIQLPNLAISKGHLISRLTSL